MSHLCDYLLNRNSVGVSYRRLNGKVWTEGSEGGGGLEKRRYSFWKKFWVHIRYLQYSICK